MSVTTNVLSREVVGDKSWATELIYNAVLSAEEHELDEWLKIDGRCIREPHPERERATT